MVGIYLIKNDVNDLVYVGQSVDIENRIKQHFFASSKQTIDKAIRTIGKEHFSCEVLEECTADKLDEREKYWINFYDSRRKGYNRTNGGRGIGGDASPRAVLTEDIVIAIRDCYANHIPFRDVVSMFSDLGVKPRGLKKIWLGETWKNVHMDVYTPENKEWHKTKAAGHCRVGDQSNKKLNPQEIQKIIEMHNSGCSINDISKKLKRDYGTIQRYINNKDIKTKPGRKIAVVCVETGTIYPSVLSAAKAAGCGATTLRRLLNSDRTAGSINGTKVHWKSL